ncbi:putative toxin-antitoxin system toxin component, PIN family [Mucilaginibacter sp. FT3.2]|uniref:putative toxin-antitoxin system toxin component, PIN family n=1 Tax=Mucilaginibacter sp. FT3.2 TaxID=2723090 RepID=UPI001620916B|nr:putative toxin-antitoxin system toxin component, PIN family [Mucilaginibacter sp. FT3.2]MBB6229635.1 putative PIN family toxin of toxin-antitoxin system [Mucilaginibacter sp. FT3.2]
MNEFFIFDTNTLLSAVFNQNSKPGLALKAARISGTLLVSDEIIAEYILVFSREKFSKWLSLETRINFIENIINYALPVQVTENVAMCRDPKDDKYLSLALASQANCIVTGDVDLLILHPFKNIPILNAADFLLSIKAKH